MRTVRTVSTPSTDLNKMKEIIKWCDAMPRSIEVGDSFSKHIEEELNALRPPIAELDTDQFFVDTYDLIDNTVFINIVHEDDPEQVDFIVLIPADE